jgi:hypothetical protein
VAGKLSNDKTVAGCVFCGSQGKGAGGAHIDSGHGAQDAQPPGKQNVSREGQDGGSSPGASIKNIQ